MIQSSPIVRCREAAYNRAKRKEVDGMGYKRSEKAELKPITIRFPAEVWEKIEDNAKEVGYNKTEFVRIAVAGNLERYLGTIRIMNEQQATEIKEAIKMLFDEIAQIKSELHRIGVNYNIEVKLKAIERKYANKGLSIEAADARWKETQKAKEECRDFSQENMEALISRYEQATKQVGEILCHILA